MASRQEEVLIYLRTLGAAQARRDIDKTADSLDRLDKGTKANTNSTDDNTKAVDKNTGATKKGTKVRGENTKANNDNSTSIRKVTTSYQTLDQLLGKHDRTMKRLNRTIEVQRKLNRQREIEMGKIARARSKVVKEQARLNREEEREWARHYQKSERDAARHNARIKKLRMNLLKAAVPNRPPTFRHPFRIAAYGAIIGLVMDALPVIGTGLNSLLAGGLAAINGLAPVMGLLGTLPAIAVAGGTGIAMLAAAFGGLGDAIGGDEAALAKLGPNTRSFVDEIIRLKNPMRAIKASIQETFFSGLGTEIRRLADDYLPRLQRSLTESAVGMNAGAKDFTGWLQTDRGMSTMQGLMNNNSQILTVWSQNGSKLLQILLRVANAAGPTVIRMSKDLLGFLNTIDDSIGDGSGLESFFEGAYERFLDVWGVIKDFSVGLYNIISLSDPLTEALGGMFMDWGSRFREWTESAKGQAEITDYFERMEGPLRSVFNFFGALATGLFQISQSDMAVKVFDNLSAAIPKIVSIINGMDGSYIDGMLKLLDAAEVLGEAGTFNTLGQAFKTVADAVAAVVNEFVKLPPGVQAAIINGVVFTGLLGGIASNFVDWAKGVIVAMFQITAAQAGAPLLAGAGGKGAKGGFLGKAGAIAGGAARAGVGVLGGAAIAATAAEIWEANRTKGTGKTNSEVAQAIEQGMWHRLFSNSNAAGAGAYDGGGLTGSLKRFGNNKGATASFNDWVENSPLGKFWQSQTGAKTSRAMELEKWHEIDTVLANMPLEEATKKFAFLKTRADEAGVPMETLVNELFPQYSSRIREVMRATGDMDTSIDNMVRNMTDSAKFLDAQIKTITNNIVDQVVAMAVQTSVNEVLAAANGGASGGHYVTPDFNFAGGTVAAGGLSWVGELGPELGVNRNGQMRMFGADGPELIKPNSEWGIIPSSGTFNPFGGNMGGAPEWAVSALRSAAGGAGGGSAAPTHHTEHYDIRVESINGSTTDEIYAGLMGAFEKFERDRRERRIN